jgi:hypothetical protein
MRHAKLKWLIVVSIGAFMLWFLSNKYLETRREEQATREAGNLRRAVYRYYMEHQKWPIKLADVSPFLENASFVDPWGMEYKYAIAPLVGSLEGPGPHVKVCVWSDHEVDGKNRVYGSDPHSGILVE